MRLKIVLIPITALSLFPTCMATASKLDINPLLKSFSGCTLHLNTYEFMWGPGLTSVGAKIAKQFVEDQVPYTEPVIISRSTTKLGEIDQEFFKKHGFYIKVTLPNASDFSKFHFKPKLFTTPCVAELFILSGTSSLPQHYELDVSFLGMDSFSVIMTDLVQKHKKSRAYYPMVNLFKEGVYRLLLADDLEKVKDTWESVSNYRGRFSSWVRYANDFNRLAIRFSHETKEFLEGYAIYGKISRIFHVLPIIA